MMTIVMIDIDDDRHDNVNSPEVRRRRMRVSKQQAAENREKILSAASALFRERGLSGVGVDALTSAAGLTHGSLYSQFGSKDGLATEAVRFALSENADRFEQAKDLKAYVSTYLSSEHRDYPAEGCALAALGAEIARSPDPLKRLFTEGLRNMIAGIKRLAGMGPSRKSEDAAMVAASTMVGAIVLSRAVDDAKLADRILRVSRDALMAISR
jgi:TetR/AcrR family transcriptional repressor of nem operon